MIRAFLAFIWAFAVVLRPVVCQGADINYSNLNPNTKTYLPMLLEQQKQFWPELQNPSILAAQIDQETCITQKHKFCWSPNARLKTSREEGYGLGQITRAWDVKGNLRFDSLTELRNKHQEALAEWSWKNVADAFFQLRGIVLMNYDNYKVVPGATTIDRYAFMDAAYNGGLGGVRAEIALCKNTPGCNPEIWFGNVENTSNKARTAVNGYGKGFFYINREHVRNVIYTKRFRYVEAGVP